MKLIFFILILFAIGLGLGYFKIEPKRASVEMGDFDLKIPDD